MEDWEMAYLEQFDTSSASANSTIAASIAAPSAPAEGFSDLEWSVIRLTRADRLWTIRPFGALRRFWMRLVGRGNPRLANERLEALRQMAVPGWDFGFTVSGDDVADFLSAGFTSDQYELLVISVGNGLKGRSTPGAREALA